MERVVIFYLYASLIVGGRPCFVVREISYLKVEQGFVTIRCKVGDHLSQFSVEDLCLCGIKRVAVCCHGG